MLPNKRSSRGSGSSDEVESLWTNLKAPHSREVVDFLGGEMKLWQ